MSTTTAIEWTEVLCTNRLQRKPFLVGISITLCDLAGGRS